MQDDAIRENIMNLQHGFMWLLVIVAIVIFGSIVYVAYNQVKKSNAPKKVKKTTSKSITWIATIDKKVSKWMTSNPDFLKMFLLITNLAIVFIVVTLISPYVLGFFMPVPNEINVFELSKFICIMYCMALLISWHILRKQKKTKPKKRDFSSEMISFIFFLGSVCISYQFIQYVDLVKNIFIPFPYIISNWNPLRFFYFDFFMYVYRLQIGQLIYSIFRLFRLPNYLFVKVLCYLLSIVMIAIVYILILLGVKDNKEALSIFCKRSTSSTDDACVRTLKREVYHLSLVQACVFISYAVIWKQFY